MPGLQDSTSSAPSDRGDTSAAPNGRTEDGVPKAGGDAEIAAVAIVMRHMPHPRPIENVTGLNREMMRCVMHEHIEGVTEQHAAGHAAGHDEAVPAQRKKDRRDDQAARHERGKAKQRERLGVMRAMQLGEERSVVIDEAMHDIFDKGPDKQAKPKAERQRTRRCRSAFRDR